MWETLRGEGRLNYQHAMPLQGQKEQNWFETPSLQTTKRRHR